MLDILYIYIYVHIHIYIYDCIHTSQSDTSEFDILNSAALLCHVSFVSPAVRCAFYPGACDLAYWIARADTIVGTISSGLTFHSAQRLFTWTKLHWRSGERLYFHGPGVWPAKLPIVIAMNPSWNGNGTMTNQYVVNATVSVQTGRVGRLS